jgi:ribosome-binding protein aMBF1 (putative translation factor)
MQTRAEIYKEVAELFRERRKSLGIGFKKAGRLTGVDWQSVRRFERCELWNVSLVIEKLAKGLEVELTPEQLQLTVEPHKLTRERKTDFGKRVTKVRQQLKLSQKQFGELFDLADNIISAIENGTYNKKWKSRTPKGFIEKFEEFEKSLLTR